MALRIAIVTGDGGESYEALYAYHRFLEAGHDAFIAAPSKRRLHLVMHDFEPGWDTYVERPGYGLDAHATIDELRASDLDALVLLGGRAPEYLRRNQHLLAIIRQMDAAGKWLFSICHGIQALIAAGVVSGRAVTCYEHIRSEVEAAGGRFVEEQAARDGHIVSAQTWESHPQFYREIFRCLAGAAAARSSVSAKL